MTSFDLEYPKRWISIPGDGWGYSRVLWEYSGSIQGINKGTSTYVYL